MEHLATVLSFLSYAALWFGGVALLVVIAGVVYRAIAQNRLKHLLLPDFRRVSLPGKVAVILFLVAASLTKAPIGVSG